MDDAPYHLEEDANLSPMPPKSRRSLVCIAPERLAELEAKETELATLINGVHETLEYIERAGQTSPLINQIWRKLTRALPKRARPDTPQEEKRNVREIAQVLGSTIEAGVRLDSLQDDMASPSAPGGEGTST